MATTNPTNLLLKTLFLTALASGNRASELAAIIRNGLTTNLNKAFLPTKPEFLFENQNINHPRPPDITFPGLGNNHSLCPVTAIKIYMSRTQNLPQEDSLFIHPKSSKPLTSGRLSYWLAKAISIGDQHVIHPAGHDTRKIGGHSIAHFRQIEPAEILKNGFWHSPNFFCT